MARRGSELRDHILWCAKDVFLEQGFERASMDTVSSRAETSKRTLYAHFENKERLFLAVIDLVRGLVLNRLQTPAEYSDQPLEEITQFCCRYREILLYEASIQLLRTSMAESQRFPEQAEQLRKVLFDQVEQRLVQYIKKSLRLTTSNATAAAKDIMGRLLYPSLHQALLGTILLAKTLDPDGLDPAFDVKPVRNIVAEALHLPKKSCAPMSNDPSRVVKHC